MTEENQAAGAAVETVTMYRAEPQFEGGPTTAEVHPDEVENFTAAGWTTEAPAEQPVQDAPDPNADNQQPSDGAGADGSGASTDGNGGQQTRTFTIEEIDALADADAVRAAAVEAGVRLQAFANTGADALKAQLKKKLGLTA